jgi:membrane dipeptidase
MGTSPPLYSSAHIPLQRANALPFTSSHQLSNSLSILQQYYALGIRYMTLTHTCHNAFTDSGGILKQLLLLHHGLSNFGVELVKEMNQYELVSIVLSIIGY